MHLGVEFVCDAFLATTYLLYTNSRCPLLSARGLRYTVSVISQHFVHSRCDVVVQKINLFSIKSKKLFDIEIFFDNIHHNKSSEEGERG